MKGTGTCYPNPCPGENRRDRSNPPVVTPLPPTPQNQEIVPPVDETQEEEEEEEEEETMGSWFHHMLSSNETPTGEGWYGFNKGGGDRATSYDDIRTGTKSVVVSKYYSDGTEVDCAGTAENTKTLTWDSGHSLTFTLRKDARWRKGDRCVFPTHKERTNGVAPAGVDLHGNLTF